MTRDELIIELQAEADRRGDRLFAAQQVASGRRTQDLAANEAAYKVRYWQYGDDGRVVHPHTLEMLVADEGTAQEEARWNTRLPHVLVPDVEFASTEDIQTALGVEMRQASIRHDTDGAAVTGLQVVNGELEPVRYLITRDSRDDLRAERIRAAAV